MFTRLRNRVLTVVGPDIPALPSSGGSGGGSSGSAHHGGRDDHGGKGNLPEKFRYARPQFLQLLTYDELKASADHNVRPIIVPRDLSLLPWNTGYAECVNSGKSEWNEDQAAFHRQVLSHPSKQYQDLPYTYFGIYDGHAGYGAALAASNQFHHILHEKLVDIIDLLMPRVEGNDPAPTGIGSVGLNAILPHPILFHKQVSKDELIVGALEAAFADMDALLAEDRDKYRNAGGCTALVALFILGKLFVANAGDSRGVLCKRISKQKLPNIRPLSVYEDGVNGETPADEEDDGYVVYAEPCSFDHTPETERPRLLSVGKLNPNLMGGEYVAMEYAKKPMTKDLGTRILYRQGTMKGWTYKTLTRSDLKMPIVTGEGKRSRLLGTIGVTRGFGDHDLKALGSGLPIKPFLSCHPDVICVDLSSIESDPDADNCDGEYGVLVMATDGLWDVTYSQKVANTVFNTLKKFPTERHRYTMAAQELVAKSRGRANINGHWRLSDSRAAATVDDISVIVIPVYQYYLEYLEWKRSLQRRKPSVEIAAGSTNTSSESTGLEKMDNKQQNSSCDSDPLEVDSAFHTEPIPITAVEASSADDTTLAAVSQ
ncbi:protein phosphatase 1H [Sabethes cyaneus]|uniref:protein phosphatase 1H n=1 Tax=Sabethes cyaneus TaxID=53552 RepID=UPI00221E2BE8|nr:protein phosphatase 1H [Sabethes cyaneus]XP_053691648.1 protein phosphatase 1H [Sabethes cyaneus]